MPLSPGDITFDELEDEQEDTANLDEEQSQTDVEDEEESNVSEESETVEDIDTDELEAAFEDTEDEEEQSTESEEDVSQDEEVEETEDQEEDDVEEEIEERFVDDLASQFGLDPEEDFDGNLDDTWDDAIQVAKEGAKKMAQNEVNTFFEQYPDVAQYGRYRANGGDPETFREEVLNAPSYEDMELEGREGRQEEIVREKLREVEGFGDEKVDQKVETYKSSGVLKQEAEDAKEILSAKQEQRKQELIEQQEKKAEERREEIQKEQQRFKETIHESNDLAGLQLPEDQKDTFENYLFEPVNEEGMTQAEVDYQNMDREQTLALYYLTFQGLDSLSDMIDNQASTKRAERLSEKLKKSSSRDVSDKSKRGSQSRKKSNDPDLENFDLDSAIS